MTSYWGSRWITGNEYTSFSCVYPDCFGCAVGFAESMRLMVDMGVDEDLLPVSKQWARVLKTFHYMPLEEAKKEADEAIASGFKSIKCHSFVCTPSYNYKQELFGGMCFLGIAYR